MAQSNCMRNLSGGGPANPCWPYQPAAARTAAGSCGSSGVFRSMPVGPGVLLCWLARSLPRVRYKTLPAGLLGGENGIKLSLHAEKAPNWAISGEQGEFCTGHAARAGVQGEFCTEAARCGCYWANNAVLWRSPRASRRAMAAPWRCSCALRPGSPCPGVLHAGGGGGFALHEAFWRRVAGVSNPRVVQFPRLAAARAWFAVVWPPKCRPIG